MKKIKRIVLKVGTSTLTGSSKLLNKANMLELVRKIAALHQKGYQVCLVTSGAIAAGRELLGDRKLPKVLSTKQLLASVGQGKLIEVYEKLFNIYSLQIGQILLTRADLENRERFLNAKDTINAMLEEKIIPVINENDALSTQEIRVGDNDNLAALTGILIQADLVILLTDQKGLYDKDPRYDSSAKLIKDIYKIDDSIKAMAGGSGSSLGTGGMSTKVIAAQSCMSSGIDMAIIQGNDYEQIDHILEQKDFIGTYFHASLEPRALYKQWIDSATIKNGNIYIDQGAQMAIINKGSSLLPSGVTKVEGEFKRGSSVNILNQDNQIIGCGISNYSSFQISLILGKNSNQIESILGFSYGDNIVHRDNLTLKQ